MKKAPVLMLAAAVALLGIVVAWAAGATTNQGQSQKVTLSPKGNWTIVQAKAFRKFPVYYPGAISLSLPLKALHRVDAAEYPGEEVRADFVNFLYGSCEALPGEGCMSPLQIKIWNACERYQDIYAIEPDETLTIRGVPAAFYEGRTRLELYSGTVAIVIFGEDREQLIKVARMLRGLNSQLAPEEDLPEPAAGVRGGKLACQSG